MDKEKKGGIMSHLDCTVLYCKCCLCKKRVKFKTKHIAQYVCLKATTTHRRVHSQTHPHGVERALRGC